MRHWPPFHLWLKGSLRRRLLLWLLPATLFAGIVASASTYWGALGELSDLLNGQMRYIAQHTRVTDDEHVTLLNPHAKHDTDKADEVVLQVWHGKQLTFTTNPAVTLPPPQGDGLRDVWVNNQAWHTFTDQRGDRLIRVAQARDARWDALAGLAVHLFWPVLSLLPLLALFLWFGIGYGLKPLHRIGAELSWRDADSLEPVAPGPLPNEVKPLVNELNDLLQRLDHAFTVQKHFIADAAHELRTPLMALSIQTQLAQSATTEEERQQALAQLQGGLSRLTHLVQQLLTLARLEPEGQHEPRAVELSALCKSVVLDQIQLAEAKHIDLGVVTWEKAEVLGDADTLRILLNNLVDNAIRYTPENGTVDLAVRCNADVITLEVCDTGPGIPEEERPRVLERFYRCSNQAPQGSGLGLSVVQRIAERHGARVELGCGLGGAGLRVAVHFPVMPLSASPRSS